MEKLTDFKARILTGRTVFVVYHGLGRIGDKDRKDLGVFSTRKYARQVIEEMKTKAGFRQSAGKFFINEYVVDRIEWSRGFEA